MFEVRFFIPVADNSGRTFDAAHHAAFEAVALAAFGGFTREANEVQGAWVEGETTYRDQLRVYVVAVRSIVDGEKVGDVATFAKTHYGQLALYVAYLGISEIL